MRRMREKSPPMNMRKRMSPRSSVNVPDYRSSPMKVKATKFRPVMTPQQARIKIIGALTIGRTVVAVSGDTLWISSLGKPLII